MNIVTILSALVIAAFTGIMYVQHVSRVGRNQSIPPILLNRRNKPSWIDALYGLAMAASVFLLYRVLPLWASFAVFWAVTLPAVEVVRRRHNHRVGQLAVSGGDSDLP